jgi:transposase
MKHAEDNTSVAGIDIAKTHLDVALYGRPCVRRFKPDGPGLRRLVDWLVGQGVCRAGLEATGGYERPVMQALRLAGITVVRHQPLEVRLFARIHRIRAKNDRIDAQLIAMITAQIQTVTTQAGAGLEELAERMTAYEQISEQLAQLKTYCEHVHLDDLRARYDHLIEQTRSVKAQLLADIIARIRADPALAMRYELLRSLPGIGEVCAAVMLIRMPELGSLERGQAASLIGVAPFDRDSGLHKGQRRITGGRARPRRFLYIAALAARRCSALFMTFAQRLKDNGKRPKVVIVALMRKLIEAANLVLKRASAWEVQTPST